MRKGVRRTLAKVGRAKRALGEDFKVLGHHDELVVACFVSEFRIVS